MGKIVAGVIIGFLANYAKVHGTANDLTDLCLAIGLALIGIGLDSLPKK